MTTFATYRFVCPFVHISERNEIASEIYFDCRSVQVIYISWNCKLPDNQTNCGPRGGWGVEGEENLRGINESKWNDIICYSNKNPSTMLWLGLLINPELQHLSRVFVQCTRIIAVSFDNQKNNIQSPGGGTHHYSTLSHSIHMRFWFWDQ